MKKFAVVLAAGKGVRMRSDLPKVSHILAGKPLIVRVVDSLKGLKLDGIIVIVGYKEEIVRQELKSLDVTFAVQKEQLGTGHAVMQARPYVPDGSLVLVLNGDVPLIKAATLKELIDFHVSHGSAATVLSAVIDDPNSYGRIVRSADGSVAKIVEQKDASGAELAIREVNTGTYCFDSKALFDSLSRIRPENAQKEYYLTDVIGIIKAGGLKVCALAAKDPAEALGVNTAGDLARLEGMLANALRH